jgi:KipI family sensor histidine kinase inhibitor
MAFARVVTAAARGSSGSSTSMLVRRSCHRSTAALSRCRRVVRRAGGSVLGRASYASLAGAEPDCRAVGEGALLVRFGSSIDLQVNERALACLAELDKGSALAGVTDVLPAYASVMVHFDPTVVPYSQVESWCLEAARSSASASADDSARTVTIPVRYGGEDGPDTDEVMRLTGLGSAEDVAQAHYNGEYRVYFLGFMGGFPYLGGLPDILAAVPRLGFPRQAVPKGAVGIAAGQTGVYTLCTPGGWHLLGQTSLELFDPTQDPPALLRAGDKIKFVPTDEPAPPESSGAEAEGSSSPPVGPPANPWVEVVAPGPLTSVQDIRRSGYSRHGVSPSGAADELALRMGNALVGNDEGDAGLEVTLGGLKLRCLEPCHVALTGADCGAKVKRLGRTAKIDVRVNEVQLLQVCLPSPPLPHHV